MREGREPLRTFGDLKRFFQPESEVVVEPPVAKKPRRERSPTDESASAASESVGEIPATGVAPHGNPAEAESGIDLPAANESSAEESDHEAN
jgi:hypothetical protein